MRLIDPAEAVRKRGRNPVAVERAWMLYELKQDPEIRAAMKQRIFQELGTLEQQKMEQIPEGAGPQVPMSDQPAGALPGISQGLPVTGFVPPQPPAGGGGGGGAPPPGPPPGAPMPPGPPPGSAAGVRGAPPEHIPGPGGA